MKKYLLIFVLALVAGCSSIGAAPTQSISEQLAYGYAGVASARTTCAQQVQALAMTVATGQACLTQTDAARAALDAATAATATGDTSTAVAKLAAATAVLTQLQFYLNVKGQ